VVGASLARHDDRVLEPATVWMVKLRRGDLADIKGTLQLDGDAVRFTESKSGIDHRIAYAEVRRARRVRGSPILIVAHGSELGTVETAFYFSQPPPLRAATPSAPAAPTSVTGGRPLGPFGAFRRTSRRRHMRENVRYLTVQSGGKKPLIQAWADEITARRRS
jgi:hypothetical protein